MEELLDVGEVRARTGLPASTLHFYERQGLIRSVERNGLCRQYARDVIDRLAVVVVCQRAGFSLQQVRDFLAATGEPRWKQIATTRLAEVRRQIHLLQEIEQALAHALRCPSDDVLRCEYFRAALAAAIPLSPDRRPRQPRNVHCNVPPPDPGAFSLGRRPADPGRLVGGPHA